MSSLTPLFFGTSACLTALYTTAVIMAPYPSIKLETSLGIGRDGITPRVLPTSFDCPTLLKMTSTGFNIILKRAMTSSSTALRTARRLVSAGRRVVYTG